MQKPTIIQKPMKKNKYSRPATNRNKTTKIAWHFTGQHDVPAKNTVSYFSNVVASGYKVNGRYIYASSHLVIGLEGEIYQLMPFNEIAYTTNQANYYSIGIECATTGTDDHYSDKEYVSMVKTGAWLAQIYGLDPREDFIRHYDVTGKICPRYFVNHKIQWKQFKLDCYNYMVGRLKESNIRNCTNGKGNSILEGKITPKLTIEDKKTYNVKAKIIGCTTLNVRATRPNKNGDLGRIKFILKVNDVVEIGYSLNGWCSIYTSNDYGFVNKKYLEII